MTLKTECLLGKGYTSPVEGQVVDSGVPAEITWNPRCWNGSSHLDLYLYTRSTRKLLPIHAWRRLPAPFGAARIKLAPYWWIKDPQQTLNASLFLTLVPHANQPWDTSNPYGPTFITSYTPGAKPPSDAYPPEDDNVISAFDAGGTLTSAGKTAAVVCDLVVALVVLAVLIRQLHIERNNRTADFAERVDQRMSRISIDWTRGGDGSLGPVPGSRPASFLPTAPAVGAWRTFGFAPAAPHTSIVGNFTHAYGGDVFPRESLQPSGLETHLEEPASPHSAHSPGGAASPLTPFGASTPGRRGYLAPPLDEVGDGDATTVPDEMLSTVDETITAVPASDIGTSQPECAQEVRQEATWPSQGLLEPGAADTDVQSVTITDMTETDLTDLTSQIEEEGLPPVGAPRTLRVAQMSRAHRLFWREESVHSAGSGRRITQYGEEDDSVPELPSLGRSGTLLARMRARRERVERRMVRDELQMPSSVYSQTTQSESMPPTRVLGAFSSAAPSITVTLQTGSEDEETFDYESEESIVSHARVLRRPDH